MAARCRWDWNWSKVFKFCSFSCSAFSSSLTHLFVFNIQHSVFTYHYCKAFFVKNIQCKQWQFGLAQYSLTKASFWHLKDVNQIFILMTFLMTKIYYIFRWNNNNIQKREEGERKYQKKDNRDFERDSHRSWLLCLLMFVEYKNSIVIWTIYYIKKY